MSNLQLPDLDVLKLKLIGTPFQGPPGPKGKDGLDGTGLTPEQLSKDSENILKFKLDGLFAAPNWAQKEW